MKYLLLLALLLIPAHAWAWGAMAIGTHSNGSLIAGGGAGCEQCTGGLLFAAYFEQDGDVTTGTPCGCSAGDTAGAANDSCTITGGYLYAADNTKYFAWDVSSEDIFDPSAGSMLIDFEVETWANNAELFSVYVDASNRFQVYLLLDDEVTALYHWGASSVQVVTSGTTNLTTGNRYFVIVRWTASDVDPNMYIAAYDSSENLKGSADPDNSNLTDWSSGPGAGHFKVGNRTSEAASIKIHKVKVWDSYAGAPTCGGGTCAAE